MRTISDWTSARLLRFYHIILFPRVYYALHSGAILDKALQKRIKKGDLEITGTISGKKTVTNLKTSFNLKN